MKKIIAFADEFGNNSFDFNSQGSHFIITSVIMNSDELVENNKKLEVIRKKHFQTGEIKSSKVGKNHNRRKKILKELNLVNFSIYSVVVDKRKLYTEGFKQKRSFYKYLNGLLYKELYRTFPQLNLIVDEHGGNDFMRSFKKYVNKNHIRTLFSFSEFTIGDSKNEIGIQLADFMTGTLGYIFDEKKKNSESDYFFQLIKDKIISLNFFPKEYKVEEFQEDDGKYNEYNSTLAELSIMRIFDYLDKAKGNSQLDLDRINFLKLLLLFSKSNHHKKFTTSNEFIQHMTINRSKNITPEYFKTKIVGHLRDKGVLIASGRSGYKIPSSINELKQFIRHGKNMILPMLRRIKECREILLLATNNDCDLLDSPEFKKLKLLIEN